MYFELTQIIGLTFDKIEKSDSRIVFFVQDGRKFTMLHQQECCEGVYIQDIVGDLDDLVGAPIVRAEERTQDMPRDEEDWGGDIGMWTFYEFATPKGSVTIRWCGTSNGYYSVGVTLFEGDEYDWGEEIYPPDLDDTDPVEDEPEEDFNETSAKNCAAGECGRQSPFYARAVPSPGCGGQEKVLPKRVLFLDAKIRGLY